MRIVILILAATLSLPGLTAGVSVTVSPERLTKADQTALTVYMGRCVVCHGPTGAGDGVAAMGMQPKPRAFADPAWQTSVDDKKLMLAIMKGGVAAGLSPLMPANADLKPPVAEALVRLIRGQRSAKVHAELAPAAPAPVEGEKAVPTAPIVFDGVMQVGGKFTIREVPAGAYTLTGFLDDDQDGKHTKGEVSFTQKVTVVEKGAAVTVKRNK